MPVATHSLLPLNRSDLERALEIAPDVPVPIIDLWNPATCPESLLPYLAWALHISDTEGWSLAETSAQKRDLLAGSFELHRKKGTRWAVVEALRRIGVGIHLREWWETSPPGAPFTFTIQFLTPPHIVNDPDLLQLAIDVVDEWKPVSRHHDMQVADFGIGRVVVASVFSPANLFHAAGEGVMNFGPWVNRGALATAAAATMILATDATLNH